MKIFILQIGIDNRNIFYADIECDTSNLHEAYWISYIKHNENGIKHRCGKGCLYKFMDDLPNEAVVYFHNLGYDITAFHKFYRIKTIRKGRRVMIAEFVFKKKHITFKDSYSLITKKLEEFPNAFNLTTGQKEMFPYKYYTFERIINNNWICIISKAGKEELKWNQEQFEKNIDSIPNCRINKDVFDMRLYVKFYCSQDVRI